ncbi:rhomboid family intramembrane serine protease [Flavobacteriaceae bacterium F08102]|nr:rhomboid family intramembrane serine protease [Flavobacteriaceae bacterium F08102]
MKETEEPFKFTPSVIGIPLYAVLFLWVVFWAGISFDWYLIKYGIYPRTALGLRGILFSPFIHSDTSHLINNSIPLIVLLTTLLYFYREIALKVMLLGILLSGLLTWVIARDAYHIGASGVIYLLFSFILFSGLIRRYYRLVAVSLIVVFLYGGMIWYVLPIEKGVSWEGHLSGFLVGLIFAVMFRQHGPQKERFIWDEEAYEEAYWIDEEEEA